ncbi:MAG TPA: LysM peptidoglycan-binding domain-containing protein [Ktedonobacteraceae bacterium]|nr:LysM peptidoglycan-binding domain-containing protein [Ktedonobacteraceae bacterium]
MSQHPQPRPGQEYTVQSGDTLWGIAQRAYNDPEDWDTIYDANKGVIGNNPNLIYLGQRLQIPSQSDPHKKKPVPTSPPTTHMPPTPPLPPTTHMPPTPPPTPPTPPPTTSAPPPPKDDNDSPLDWIQHELGEKKDD